MVHSSADYVRILSAMEDRTDKSSLVTLRNRGWCYASFVACRNDLGSARVLLSKRGSASLGCSHRTPGRAAEEAGPNIAPTEGKRKPSRSKQGERTRLQLIDAAEQIFGERGYNDASIVDITRAAGVAQGTFYVHFSSKSELFQELVRTRRAELQNVAREAAYKHDGGRDLVHAGFKAWFEWVAKHASIVRVMREAEFVEPALIEDLYRVHAREQTEGLERSLAAGRLEQIDPEVVAWCLIGMAEAIAMRWIVWENEGQLPPERLDAFVDTAMRAMGFLEGTAKALPIPAPRPASA